MAELALKIGTTDTYDDEDILCAFNQRRIRCVHAEHICWPRIAGVKVGGQLGTTQPLLEKMYLRTAQYKTDRIGRDLVRRTNLWTLNEVVYGSPSYTDTEPIPIEDPDRPGHMIHCCVAEFFDRRLAAGKLPLFGAPGREICYVGGRTKKDAATIELIWDDIEADTALRRVDHDRFPAGSRDLKTDLFIAVDEFDDATAEELVSPLIEEGNGDLGYTGDLLDHLVAVHGYPQVAIESWPEDDLVPIHENQHADQILRKRKYHVDWQAAATASLSASIGDIQNEALVVDMREEYTFSRVSIVLTKVAK